MGQWLLATVLSNQSLAISFGEKNDRTTREPPQYQMLRIGTGLSQPLEGLEGWRNGRFRNLEAVSSRI